MATIKWTPEIMDWIKSKSPVKEHGYKTRKDFLDELNKTFGTSFTIPALALVFKCNGLSFGFNNRKIARKNYNQRPVGSVRMMKGYVFVKVAEPDKWDQLHRYIYSQNHPEENIKGKVIMFLDGDIFNFNLDNLVCITRSELSVMNCNKLFKPNMTKEERECLLLMAKIAIAKNNIFGDVAKKVYRKNYWNKIKNNPEVIQRRKEWQIKHMEELRNNPEKMELYRLKCKINNQRRRKHV